jgi:tetratricopeptide (TPR) repeat protein
VLAVCVGAGSAAALIGDNGNAPRQTTPTTHRAASSSAGTAAKTKKPAAKKQPTATTKTPAAAAPATQSQTTQQQTTTTTATTQAPAANDGRSPAQLNNAGYAMLPGDPQGALPLLQSAVQKFRASGDRSSIDYAYSLYNLGWALRLAGRPAEAIPLLQERLQISDYKRGIVEKELRTAQQQAGQAPSGGKGKKPKGSSGGD